MSAGLLLNSFYRILSGFISVDYAAKAFLHVVAQDFIR